MIHQTGAAAYEELAPRFRASGVSGEIHAFLDDMPAAFAEADLVVSRAGMGAVSEIAAAGKPSILVPLPTASDQHQLRNAEALRTRRRGAAGSGPGNDRRAAGARDYAAGGRIRRAGSDGAGRPGFRPARSRPPRGGDARIPARRAAPDDHGIDRGGESRNNTVNINVF